MDHLKKTVGTFSNLYRDTHAPTHHARAFEMLDGRTTYLSPSHTYHHKTRVTHEEILKDGLFYLVVTTEDMGNVRRGINWLIFDTQGLVIAKGERVPNQNTATTVVEANRWIDEHLTEQYIVNHYLQAAQTALYRIAQEHRLIEQAATVLAHMDANNLTQEEPDREM